MRSLLIVIAISLPSLVFAQPAVQRTARTSDATLELGGAFGHFWQDNERDGDDFGFVARLRLAEILRLEGEVGRVHFDAGGRRDRIGGSLLLELTRWPVLRPYLVAGAGALAPSVGDTAGFAEAGGGIDLRLHRRLSIVLDARLGGHLAGSSDAGADEGAKSDTATRDTRFARWRAMAMLRF